MDSLCTILGEFLILLGITGSIGVALDFNLLDLRIVFEDLSDFLEEAVGFAHNGGRVEFEEDLIVDLALRVKEDKKYYFDATINFRWGASAHVAADDFDFAASLNKLMDVLDVKVKKEKDKIQEKK